MTFRIPTYTFDGAAKKLNFFGEKKGSNFCQKYEILHRSSAKLRLA